jgi:putative transcriptional regulator
MKNPPVQAGMFLVAAPGLRDPNFARTVVLMCDHSPAGSLGLVVNRPADLTTAMLLPDVEVNDLVYSGGPVERGKAMVLHRQQAPIEGSLEVVDGIHLGGDPEALRQLFHQPSGAKGPDGRPAFWRVYLGYAGWGEGQLDAELRAGGWVVCPAQVGHVFASDPSKVWTQVLRELGREYEFLAGLPLDPSLN